MAAALQGNRERPVALAAVAGGALIAIGAFLPWLSLFAGLHPMRGVIGLYGRLVAGGGIGCVMAGAAYWRRPLPVLRRTLALLGWVLVGFTGWLTVQLLLTYRGLHANPMLVPRLGPGLFVALGGAVGVGVTCSSGGCSRRNSHPRPSAPEAPPIGAR